MKKYLSTIGILVLFSFVILAVKVNAQSATCFSNQIYYLQYGSRDSSTKGEVTKLQNFLIQKGFLGANPSGYFGPATKAAAIAYQKSKGLTAQGLIGNMTRKVMNADGCEGGSISSQTNTSTWKTYTDSTYGYSFNYPSNIALSLNSYNLPNLYPYFSIDSISTSFTSLNDVLKSFSSNEYTKKYITIGNVQGLSVSGQQMGTEVFIPINGNKIMLVTADLSSDLVKQIFTTFTFTNIPTGYKNYSNNNLGFSFNYPNSWNLLEDNLSKTVTLTPDAKYQFNGKTFSLYNLTFKVTDKSYFNNRIATKYGVITYNEINKAIMIDEKCVSSSPIFNGTSATVKGVTYGGSLMSDPAYSDVAIPTTFGSIILVHTDMWEYSSDIAKQLAEIGSSFKLLNGNSVPTSVCKG